MAAKRKVWRCPGATVAEVEATVLLWKADGIKCHPGVDAGTIVEWPS